MMRGCVGVCLEELHLQSVHFFLTYHSISNHVLFSLGIFQYVMCTIDAYILNTIIKDQLCLHLLEQTEIWF